MRLPLLLIAVAPIALLAACASAPGGAAPGASNPVAAKTSTYGMFLAGESALNSGRSIEAA
jgi:hypothetical protein